MALRSHSHSNPLTRLRSFLNDILRLAARDYEPTDDDIVRARLRTVGVQEYKIVMENYGTSAPVELPCKN